MQILEAVDLTGSYKAASELAGCSRTQCVRGAIMINGGTDSVSNSTIVGNHARSTAGGIDRNDGTVSVGATILASNSGSDCGGLPVTDNGYNIDDDGTCHLSLPIISDYFDSQSEHRLAGKQWGPDPRRFSCCPATLASDMCQRLTVPLRMRQRSTGLHAAYPM